MIDFNCIAYQYLIPVLDIGVHSGNTIYITASDITPTKAVFINKTSTTDFVVVSRTKLLVDIPAAELNVPISSVTLSGSSGEVGLLSFDIKSQKAGSDSKYVVQRFLRTLLMDPGSDIFSPEDGTGLLSKLGNVDFEDIEVLITSSIQDAADLVRRNQKVELPDSKTLNMVKVLNVSYSINTLTASVSLQFVFADGSTVDTDFNIAS